MRKNKSIDEYTKEELYYELQKQRAINDCLLREISDIKEIIYVQQRGSHGCQMNVSGNGNQLVHH